MSGPEWEERAKSLIPHVKAAPGRHAQGKRDDETGVADAYVSRDGSSQVARDEHGAKDGRPWDRIERRARELEHSENEKHALAVAELPGELIDHLG